MSTTISYELVEIASEFTTNTHTKGAQLAPDVLGLSGGGFVSAYNNAAIHNGSILVDFYDRDHVVTGSARMPYATPPGTAADGQPSLTELGNGNVLVAWDDNIDSAGTTGIKGRIYTAAGAEVSGLLTLSETGFLETADPKVAALASGGFVVAYDGGDSAGVLTRVFDADGAQVQGAGPVDTTVSTDDAQVTALRDGGYAVTWTDHSNPQAMIMGRVYDDEGGSQTDVFTIGEGGDNTRSSVAEMANGNFAVAYVDTGWGGDEGSGAGITLQMFTPDGSNATPFGAIHVNTPSAASESGPDVTVLENGFVAVSWTSASRISGYDIYARIFDQQGHEISVNGSTGPLVLTNSAGQDSASAISVLLNGQFITSWQDSDTLDGSAGQITSKISEVVRHVVGDDTGDLFVGDVLRDSVVGAGGDDTVFGFGGADTLQGGSGADILTGHGGRDVLEGGAGNDHLDGSDGSDVIYGVSRQSPESSIDQDDLSGDDGNDKIVGSAGADQIDGGDGDDKCAGGLGSDHLFGVQGDDRLDGGAGDDTILAGSGSDTVHGGDGADVIEANVFVDHSGSTNGDILFGGTGDDTLGGSDTADVLNGGKGDDLVIGIGGADRLTGGAGADTFLFTNASQSTNSDSDTITDLQARDLINLTGMDADANASGNQAFVLVGQFSHTAGELVVAYQADGPFAGSTTIQGDQDGDGLADFTILAQGDHQSFDHFAL